VSLEGKQEE
jgi:hypothetical protein